MESIWNQNFRQCISSMWNAIKLVLDLKQSTYICQMSRVFTNSPEDLVPIPDWIILKTQRTVLDAALLNTHHYKVRIKGKVEQSREWSSTSPIPRCISLKREPSGYLRLGSPTLLTYLYKNTFWWIRRIVFVFFNLQVKIFKSSL